MQRRDPPLETAPVVTYEPPIEADYDVRWNHDWHSTIDQASLNVYERE